jgi:hypothetical protein
MPQNISIQAGHGVSCSSVCKRVQPYGIQRNTQASSTATHLPESSATATVLRHSLATSSCTCCLCALPVRPAGIGPEVWTPVVFGEFPEDDARAFLEEILGQRKTLVDDSTWSRVYEVSHTCGPSLHLWARRVSAANPICGVLTSLGKEAALPEQIASACILALPDPCAASILCIVLIFPLMPCRSAEATRKL